MNPGGEEPPDVRQVVVIRNSLGLHARAAARLVTLVRTFDATVKVTKGEVEVAGDSIMGLMMLAAGPGTELELRASGAQAREAVTALAALIEIRKFDEE